MFCPRCSKKFESETSYCRTCGLSLDEVRRFVTGEAETEPEFRKRPSLGLIRIGTVVFILGMVVAIANAALSTALGLNIDAGKVIFLLLIAIGMLFIGLGFLFPRKRYVKLGSKVDLQNDTSLLMPTSTLGNQLGVPSQTVLESEFAQETCVPLGVEVSSVTEHTTRKLG